MKRNNINRLNSSKQVQSTVNNDPPATSGITGFAAVKTELDNKIAIVESSIEISESPSTGVTMDTKALRKQTLIATFICANGLVSFASDVPVNNTLRNEAKITISGMNRLSKEEFALKCETIVNLASANAAGILPKGVSATDITDAQSLVNVYKTANNFPQTKIQDKKAAGEFAIATLDEIMLDLFPNKMDPMINTLIKSNFAFYKLYYDARKILNLGQGTTRITYTLMQGTSPVNAATASIINKMVVKKPRTKPYPVQTSNPAGIIIHDKLGTGLFDITISKEEYLDKVLLNNRVKLGKSLDLGIIQFKLAPKSGILLPAEIRNLFSPDSPFWTVGQKIQVRNTTQPNPIESPIVFYPAQKPNDAYSGNNGETLTNGQQVSIIISITDLPAYINVVNLGTLPATFEIKFM